MTPAQNSPGKRPPEDKARTAPSVARPVPGPARCLLLCLLPAAFALFVFAVSPGMDAYGRARFGDTMSGRAWRPFVGRVLLPWTVRGIAAITPEPVRAAVCLADPATIGFCEALEAGLADLDHVVDVTRYRVGPSVAAHTGPGTAGGFFWPILAR